MINFPNLRRLTYTNQGEKVEEDHLDYLLPFLSPSLREIKITALDGYPFWQSLSSVLKFLNAVSSKCLELETLCIYPGKPSSNTGLNRNFRMVTFTDDTLAMHQTMGSFRSLRKLVISPTALEPNMFRAVSSYLYLETLIIRSKAYGGPVYDKYDLDDTAFPALRSLALIDLDPHIMKKLCNVEPLLCGLEHASIRFGPGSDATWKSNGDRGGSLFSFVKCCPRLAWLKFDIGKSNEGLSIPKLTDLFRLRPLRSVNLTALVGLDERTKWPELFDALPLVEDFRVPRNDFHYLELRDFATMLPRLRFLEISSLNFRPNLARVARDLERLPNPSQTPLRFQFTTDIYGFLKEYKTIAKCLHALWPNVIVKVKPDPHSPTEILAAQLSGHINRALRELRQLSAS
ncbi:hypothetical protein FRC12_005062 [Ceratobasidium sp. 428]|nr:hypothetical protein FRC12_005062 [Ceratobasidium sp. 428]